MDKIIDILKSYHVFLFGSGFLISLLVIMIIPSVTNAEIVYHVINVAV